MIATVGSEQQICTCRSHRMIVYIIVCCEQNIRVYLTYGITYHRQAGRVSGPLPVVVPLAPAPARLVFPVQYCVDD